MGVQYRGGIQSARLQGPQAVERAVEEAGERQALTQHER